MTTLTPMNPSILTYSCWSQHQTSIIRGLFILFGALAMTMSILIICFVPPKQINKSCQWILKTIVDHLLSSDASHPRHVAVGYFNKDNYRDLVVANSNSDSIGIFLGYGNGSFTSQLTYPTGRGSRPYWIGIGDFNNDQQADIVVANYGTNNLGVFLGNGNGKFSDMIITSLHSSRPRSFAIGDFNNDNRLDIVVISNGTLDMTILLGFNNGSFQIGANYNMGYDSFPYSIAIGDFNNDNQLDCAIVNYGISNLVILLSNKNRTYTSHQYSTGKSSNPSSVIVDDINNDHILDIAVTNSGTGNIGIFYGYGNGSFRTLVTHLIDPYFHPEFIVVTDFDNDNISDMAIVSSVNNNLIIFKGNGNETFTIITKHYTGFNSNPCSIAIGDFDNDNKSDIVITNNGANNILVLTLYGVYPTSKPMVYSTGQDSSPYSSVLADFNGDKQLDIVTHNIDIKSIGLFVGLADGSFSNRQIMYFPEGVTILSEAVGDFNNDNISDLVVTINEFGIIGICFGQNGTSLTFGGWYSTADNFAAITVTVADINNDNNLDIITGHCWTNRIGIFLGYGNGTFADIISYSTGNGTCPISIAVADFNSDHLPDLVVADSKNPSISIYLGNGNGALLERMIISTGGKNNPFYVTVGDLNNDNRCDIVFVYSMSYNIGILLGYGNGTFGSITTYFIGKKSFPRRIALADLNKDTTLDIVMINQGELNICILIGNGDGTFPLQLTFTNKDMINARTIGIGDFNNDNILDIAVTDPIAQAIFVYLIDLIGVFGRQTNYSTGASAHPYSIAIGHFNNDSRLDLVVANSGNDNIQILLNDNKGTFRKTTICSTGFNSHPQSVLVADFNKDNRLDIATANFWDNSINVFAGFNDGTFDEASRHATGLGSFPNSIAISDFNNDSWIDIVVANQGADNVGVFLGFNYATFTSYTIQITPRLVRPFHVVTADFNNDSRCDIAVAHWVIGTISVYLGYGNGSFAEEIVLEVGSFPDSISVGDFNTDNHLDIAVIDWGHPGINIFFGYGNGTFTERKSYLMDNGSSLVSIATGDFNNDSISDIVISDQGKGYIGVCIGYANGTFTKLEIYWILDGSLPAYVVVSDFNNDNILDIVVANSNQNNIGILFGFGNGTFRNVKTYSTGNNSDLSSIAVGDFNKDNWIDIVVANRLTQTIGIFFGYDNETFSSQVTYSIGFESSLTKIIVADVNGDSILDIVFGDCANGNSNIGIFYGYGDGTFTMPKLYSTGYDSQPSSIAINDFDNDRRVDMAITNSNTASIVIMLRHKSEPFGTQTTFSTGIGSHPISVAVGDFNNDNQSDIVVANYGVNNIGIFLGYNNGSFAQQKIYSIGNSSNPSSVAVGDFNNDKQVDIIVTNIGTDNICILQGYGNGTFVVVTIYPTGIRSAPSFVAIHDLNKDNHLDIVIANWGINKIFIFFGLGNTTFSPPNSYSLGYDAHPQSIAIGDFNDDNLLDIAVANYDTNQVQILLQTC